MVIGGVEATGGVGDFAGVGHAGEEVADDGVGLAGGVGDFERGEGVGAGLQDVEDGLAVDGEVAEVGKEFL